MTRNSKRIIIISIYLAIFFLIVSFLYLTFASNPTCSDGKKNQSESEVDCGGPCHPCKKEIVADNLQVMKKDIVYGGRNNQFDALIKIENPNDKYGVAEFDYSIRLIDQNGNTLAQRSGHSFILPNESKYIIEQDLYVNSKPANIDFGIDNVKWQEFSDYVEQPQLNVYNKNYSIADDKSEVFGLLKNESYFDFNSIEINIVLRDKNGKPLALGKNEMRTVNSQEQRDFKIIWPYKFLGEVSDIEIEAEADVFNSNNFIKKYLPRQKFQEYGDE